MITVIISVISGIIGGFGIGGGAVLIPALTFFTSIDQHSAQMVNLAYFIPTAIAALVVHIKNKNICVPEVYYLAGAGIPAAILSSLIATGIEESFLRTLFGIFLFVVALMEFFKKEKNQK